jgi:hypothetical protein
LPSKKPPELEAPVPSDATLYDKVRSKFRKPKLTRNQALEARPIRNPALKWTELDSGEVRIVLPRRKDATGKLLGVLFYIPKSRPVNLDVVGSKVWTLCDGEHTVEDITEALMEEHKLHRREAEVSLTEFLKMLGKRNMVGFVVPKELVQEGDEEADEQAEDDSKQAEAGSGKQERGRKRKKKRRKGKQRDER